MTDATGESLADHARRIVAAWPPLTADRIDRIVGLLRTDTRSASPRSTEAAHPAPLEEAS